MGAHTQGSREAYGVLDASWQPIFGLHVSPRGLGALLLYGCVLCCKKTPPLGNWGFGGDNYRACLVFLWIGHMLCPNCRSVERQGGANHAIGEWEGGDGCVLHRGSLGACCVNFSGHSQQVPSRNASYISLKCLCICFPWPGMGRAAAEGLTEEVGFPAVALFIGLGRKSIFSMKPT